MTSLFNIGVNGLRAQQAALNVTGQNITNANTPGYSRQRADLSAQISGSAGGIFSGAGVRVDQISRVANAQISEQIRVDQSLFSELDTLSSRLAQIEGALFDGDSGIDVALSRFFESLQNASNNPADIAARQLVISDAQGLVGRFNGVADQLVRQRQDVLSSLDTATQTANDLADLLTDINRRIGELQSPNDQAALNQVLDQRDEVLNDLSAVVGINTNINPEGQVDVFIGRGQALVLGTMASQLSATSSAEIALTNAGTGQVQLITGSVTGGELGGLLSYVNGPLNQTENQLGQLALSLSDAFNQQHRAGIDLQGRFGEAFFTEINDPQLVSQRILGIGSSSNGASLTGGVEVLIEDLDEALPTDYRLSVGTGGRLSVERLSDGETVFQSNVATAPIQLAFDGITVSLGEGSLDQPGELLIRPFAGVAANIDVQVGDPSFIALASPVSLAAADSNTGSASVRVADVFDPTHPVFEGDQSLLPPLLVRFVSDTQYQVLDNSDPSQPVPLDPDLGLLSYTPGRDQPLFPTATGSTLVRTSGTQIGDLQTSAGLVANLDPAANGYTDGPVTITTTDPLTGISSQQTTAILANSSAAQIASQLSLLDGVEANAMTEVTLSNLQNLGDGVPVALAVNGVLIEGFSDLNELADQINEDAALQASGIRASSDGQQLQLVSLQGDDLNLHFQGDPNESITATSISGETQLLNGGTLGNYRQVTIGGEVSVVLAPNVSLTADLPGVFAASPVTQRADLGFDLRLSGIAAAGDDFRIELNNNGVGDNRNGLALIELSNRDIAGQPPRSLSRYFSGIVQQVGSTTSQTNLNRGAASSLLEQSQANRESLSGVNLDEEAANLIRFEQAYNASAQIISVARDIFNTLLNSVR